MNETKTDVCANHAEISKTLKFPIDPQYEIIHTLVNKTKTISTPCGKTPRYCLYQTPTPSYKS